MHAQTGRTMGVIQRQSLKTSIISYIGVAIGTLSTLFVYPKALELLGLFRSLFDASVLVGIFVLLGTAMAAVRFFPKYEDPATAHQGLLTWLLIVTGAGFLGFLLLFPFIRAGLVDFVFQGSNKPYSAYIVYLIPLTLFVALMNLFARYISNFKRIAIPAAFEQLTIKISLPIIVLLFLGGRLGVEGVVISIVLSYFAATLGMIGYLGYLGEWRLGRPAILQDKAGLREYAQYSWYGLLSGIGSQVAFRIDGLMVAGLLQFQANGIYTIAWALSEVISKPMRAVANISGPLLAYQIEHGRLDDVREIYRKSSLNMTIIGVGLFLGIWTILPYIFRLMPNSDLMETGRYVVFFLGLAQVWDMMTGVNTEIIYYSKHYRFGLYMTLLLALLNIGANLLFIPMYGLTGAALATCLSIFLYNIAKLFFIQIRMGMHPFSLRLLPVIALATGACWLSTRLPETADALSNLVIKGAAFFLLFGFSIWMLKISPEINAWVDRLRAMVRRVKKEDGKEA